MLWRQECRLRKSENTVKRNISLLHYYEYNKDHDRNLLTLGKIFITLSKIVIRNFVVFSCA